jgi:hypothetical protein
MTTPFSNKCAILAQALADWEGNEQWEKVFYEYNLGYYFAFGAAYDMITLKDKATVYVDQAWDNLCERLGIDSYGEFSNLQEVVDFAESE